jgi:hypothetical protein
MTIAPAGRLALVALAACGGKAPAGPAVSLRAACPPEQHWSAPGCAPRGTAAAELARGQAALERLELDEAHAALDTAAAAEPLDHASNVLLWKQRGIAAAYVEDEPAAASAFDMLLALDPGHVLSYTLSPKVTFVFEKALAATRARGAPAIDVELPRGQRVGDPVPLAIEVVADPKRFLHRATLFVRARGEPTWRAADLTLAPAAQRVVLPPVRTSRPTSLEVYLRAYDERGNEVLAWADPERPREIPLRYDPPAPWYRTWWGVTAIGGTLAIAAGAAVYAATRTPPDRIDGGVVVP